MASTARIINWPGPRASAPAAAAPFNLIPDPSKRLLVVGSTGSGKSVFVSRLLAALNGRRALAILDTKGEDRLLLPGAQVLTRARDCLKWKPEQHPTLVYRPDGSELMDPELLDGWLNWIYATGDILTYVDELSSLNQRHVQRLGLTNLLSRGRSRNRHGRVVRSPVWLSTQRPRAIPMSAITEADRVVVFRLNHLDDRKTVSQDTHPELANNPTAPFNFRLYDRHMQRPIEFSKLRLGG